MRRAVSYRDAVELLGGDPPALAALDRVLAGALSLATGGVSDVVLDVFDAQPRIVLLGRDLLGKLKDKLRGASRMDRTERLAAAHAILVVAAYFDVLGKTDLLFRPKDLKLTGPDQARLADLAGKCLHGALTMAPPQPTPDLPVERFTAVLENWYAEVTEPLLGLPAPAGGSAADADSGGTAQPVIFSVATPTVIIFGGALDLPRDAVRRYQELYARLAVDVPEFRFWAGQLEHQATRAEVRRALGGVEALLGQLIVRDDRLGGTGTSPADALAREYQAVLARPILAEGDTPAGVRMPSLEEGYLDPDFRVRAVSGGEMPADEAWWDDLPVRSDLTEYLAGALTSLEAMAGPLVVLGQPGAGKSVLTKVLAARLPEAGFLPVRVVLREVAAESEIQDQVEHAIRAATGRRLEWPDVATAAPGMTPVVLLDGFDELLQATGVSQSDYLERVARFQQREAGQGRPTVVLVTTRTAVADRARYPAGSVALRLEPFRGEQVARWLDMWNAGNADRLRARGLVPLSPDALARYGALASEPLLLLMLALYDADANALQRAGGDLPLDETRLYEDLLTSFASREVAKSAASLPAAEHAARVEQEMQRLSLIAFSMVNRRRQWVTEAELDADLTALLGARGAAAGAGFELPLSPGGIAVGRFFFVQRNQAISAGTRLATFEFLHATFGEYLAARLAVQLAAGLAGQRPALAVGRTPADDDLLYALLSFGPLSARQMLRFVTGCCERAVAAADRSRLTDVLIGVLADSRQRTGHKHAGYAPAALPTAARHGIYSANLVLLILALNPSVTASRLFGGGRDPAGRWKGTALLWRSALYEQDWTDLALAMWLHRFWADGERDLEIGLSHGDRKTPEPVDLYWHYWLPPDHPERDGLTWYRPYADDLNRKMDLAAGTNDSVLRHALEPVFDLISGSVMAFRAQDGGRATSVAHDLITLCLIRTPDCPDDALADAWERVMRFGLDASWGYFQARRLAVLLLGLLRTDFRRLPAKSVGRYLAGLRFTDSMVMSEVADVAAAGMFTIPDDDVSTMFGLVKVAVEALLDAMPSASDRSDADVLAMLAARAGLGPSFAPADHPLLLSLVAGHARGPRRRWNLDQDGPGDSGAAVSA